ncbi:hypothetical protein J22TS3_43420 [Paenibacillus sp. J22TS3]|nr:hypothetical protein J22TS3_43420 [Paenibacillus sp. J22TS3]
MKIMKVLLSVLLVAIMIMPASASAKDTVKAGKITAVSGKAEIKKSGGEKKFGAFKGMAVSQGDVLLTGKDGQVDLDLDSDKEVVIGPGTTLKISQLVQSVNAAEGKTSLSLGGGQIMIKIKKKLKGDSRFEVQTPTAIMGVMGTEFIVGYEHQNTYIGVLEGKVSVAGGDRIVSHYVSPQEQLKLDQSGKGQVEKLSLAELPLFALEKYRRELSAGESGPSVDLAWIQQVDKQIELARSKSKGEPTAQAEKMAIFEGAGSSSGEVSGGSSGNPGSPSIPGQPPGNPNNGGGSGGNPNPGNGGGGTIPPDPVTQPPSLIEQPKKYDWDPDRIVDVEIKVNLARNKLLGILRTSGGNEELKSGEDYEIKDVNGNASAAMTVVIKKEYLKSAGKSLNLSLKFDHGHVLAVSLKAEAAPVPKVDMAEFNSNPDKYIPDRQTVIIPYTEPVAFISADPVEQVKAIDFSGHVQGVSITGNQVTVHLNSRLGFGEVNTLMIKANSIKHIKADTIQDQDEQVQVRFTREPHVDTDTLLIPAAGAQDQTVTLDVYNYGLNLGDLKLEALDGSLSMPPSPGYDYTIINTNPNFISLKFSAIFTAMLNNRTAQQFLLTIPLKNEDGSLSSYELKVTFKKPTP